MQLFRTLCVVAVLGALSYGAYLTLTGSPPPDLPVDAIDTGSPPRVELPAGKTDVGKRSVATTTATTTTGAATIAPSPLAPPPSVLTPGAAKLGAPSGSTAITAPDAPISSVRTNSDSASIPAVSYPTTKIPPGSFDGSGAGQLAFPQASSGAAGTTATQVDLPGTSLSGVSTAQITREIEPAASMAPVPSTPPTATPIPTSANDPVAAIQPWLSQGQFARALQQLSQSFDDPRLSPDDDRRVMELLDQLAGTVVYSREHLLEPPHTVAPGEQLDQIAAQYQMSPALLAKINGLSDAQYVSPGTQLKVVRGPLDALVDKSRRRVSLFLGQLYAGSFPVGFGRDAAVPDGQYVVGAVMPVGPSGPHRYVDLGNNLALHASLDGATLENDEARGCIRLSPEHTTDVTDILTAGSKVLVRP